MADGGALINLGELSKPATVLVEKVCNAVGIIYEPTRIKRKAVAEAEAAKVLAVANIEISDIQRRAMERLIHQEGRKQENIESITAQAAATIPSGAKPEELNDDWLAHFFKQCDTVSDRAMQSLWARLLSGEATAPGTFSKRTVDLVSSFDKKDAELFTRLCQFSWTLSELAPLIFDLDAAPYKAAGIDFSSMKHLESIGLVSFEPLTGFSRIYSGKSGLVTYFNRPFVIEFAGDNGNKMGVGQALFTSVGRELASICGAVENKPFYEYVMAKWIADGLVLWTPIQANTLRYHR